MRLDPSTIIRSAFTGSLLTLMVFGGGCMTSPAYHIEQWCGHWEPQVYPTTRVLLNRPQSDIGYLVKWPIIGFPLTFPIGSVMDFAFDTLCFPVDGIQCIFHDPAPIRWSFGETNLIVVCPPRKPVTTTGNITTRSGPLRIDLRVVHGSIRVAGRPAYPPNTDTRYDKPSYVSAWDIGLTNTMSIAIDPSKRETRKLIRATPAAGTVQTFWIDVPNTVPQLFPCGVWKFAYAQCVLGFDELDGTDEDVHRYYGRQIGTTVLQPPDFAHDAQGNGSFCFVAEGDVIGPFRGSIRVTSSDGRTELREWK